MLKWTLKEQNLLVTACEHALRVHPSESLAKPSRRFLDSVHRYFVTLSGSSKRSERATTIKLKQLAKFYAEWSPTQPATQPLAATRESVNKKVYPALSKLAEKHPNFLAGVARGNADTTRVLSSGEPWSMETLEQLAIAYVQVLSQPPAPGLTRPPRVGKRLLSKYVALSGDRGRTEKSVVAIVRFMLKARQFVVATTSSWTEWLAMQETDRRNISQRCDVDCKSLLPRMNEAIFRSLDEAVALSDEASHVSQDASRDTDGEGVLGNQDADPGVHQSEVQSSLQVAPSQRPDNNIMDEAMPLEEELQPENGSQRSVPISSAATMQDPNDEAMGEDASTGEERDESEPQAANPMAATPHDVFNDGATSAAG